MNKKRAHEYIGDFRDEWVYVCYDLEIKQELLLTPKRSTLREKCAAAVIKDAEYR